MTSAAARVGRRRSSHPPAPRGRDSIRPQPKRGARPRAASGGPPPSLPGQLANEDPYTRGHCSTRGLFTRLCQPQRTRPWLGNRLLRSGSRPIRPRPDVNPLLGCHWLKLAASAWPPPADPAGRRCAGESEPPPIAPRQDAHAGRKRSADQSSSTAIWRTGRTPCPARATASRSRLRSVPSCPAFG